MTFPQLNTVTAFSLLQSTLSVERYVTAAKERGYQTIGICDRNVLTGAVAFSTNYGLAFGLLLAGAKRGK